MESFRKHIVDPEGAVRRHGPCLLAIFLLTLAVYGRTLSFDFLTNWDDPEYITRNPVIRGLSLQHVIAAFSQPWVGNYAPLQILSYMVDYQFWGMDPVGFRLTALCLHAANGMLLYGLVTRISGTRTAGLIAGMIFVSHPVQVEAVAWLSQRKTLLSMFFFLVSFLMYLRSRQYELHSRGCFIAAVAAFIASLLSKTTAVVLPVCLAVYEVAAVGTFPGRGVWKRLIPFMIAAGVMAVVTLYVQNPEMGGGRVPYHGGSPWATFLTMIPVMVRYLRMLFLPFGLSALYIPQIKTTPDLEVWLSALLLGVISVAGVVCYRRCRPLFFWYALFFIPLLPVAQIFPLVTLINDRYLYFPMAGAAGFAGHAAVLLRARMPAGRSWVPFCAAICFAGCLSMVSYQRSAVWRDSVTLWSDAALKNPPSKDLWVLLASSYKDAGRIPEAVDVYRGIFSLGGDFVDPRYEQLALLDAAQVFMEIGSFAEAETALHRLIVRSPKSSVALSTLAACYSATGRSEAAEAAYLRSLEIAPDNPPALIGLATLFLDTGKHDNAAPLLVRAASAGAEGPDLRVALARLAASRGDRDRALGHLEKARGLGLINPARLRLVTEFGTLRDDPRFMAVTDGNR